MNTEVTAHCVTLEPDHALVEWIEPVVRQIRLPRGLVPSSVRPGSSFTITITPTDSEPLTRIPVESSPVMQKQDPAPSSQDKYVRMRNLLEEMIN